MIADIIHKITDLFIISLLNQIETTIRSQYNDTNKEDYSKIQKPWYITVMYDDGVLKKAKVEYCAIMSLSRDIRKRLNTKPI